MRRAAMLLLAVAASATGCDWREFDNLQASTPVLAVDAPSGYPSSSDFASLLIATQPPSDGSAAARFLTSGTLQTGVTVVTLSPSGSPSKHLVTSPILNGLSGQPVTAMAAVPGTDKVLLGVPSHYQGTVLTLDLAASNDTVTPFAGINASIAAEPMAGVGLAVGDVAGTTAADYVVLSGSALHLFVDGASTDLAVGPSAGCPITFANSLTLRDKIQRAVVIGKLTGAGSVIAVGTPASGAPGTVSFFGVDSGGALSCLFSLTAPVSSLAEFGRSLAIGDFDGDGVSDLLVGAPPSNAYLYRGPIAAGATPAGTFTNPASGGYTGASVAALNLDGKAGDEALVGDPDGIGNTQQAGTGDVVQVSGATLSTVAATLADNGGGSNEAYGSSVAALPFCAAPPCAQPSLLPLVGAASKAFVYFTLSGTDPRVK
ncbi:MAG TPA: FG-GAP repeat protein [Polyangia bacterium]|nr:FG-GAP repeat protein [Polyangia bacterium]